MAAGLVEQPVSKGYVIRGGSYTRAKRTMQAMEKFEKKTGKRLVVL
jgi:hypothetical protein